MAELSRVFLAALGESARDAGITFARRRVSPCQHLYRAGDRFASIYAVHSGFLKSVAVAETGLEHVLGFPMKGCILGLDGIADSTYTCEQAALADCEVTVVPFALFETLCHRRPVLQHVALQLLSGEMRQRQEQLLWIGTLAAEARIARFLLALAGNYKALGYSDQTFMLRMTRKDIGNYLALKLETISRGLSAMHANGLIHVERRQICIVNHRQLNAFAGEATRSLAGAGTAVRRVFATHAAPGGLSLAAPAG